MKWHLNVKRPAYPLDASIILESDVKDLGQAAGTTYSACFAVIENGQARYYAPESEVNRQQAYLKSNLAATKKLLRSIPLICAKLEKAVGKLSKERDVSLGRFKEFLLLYRRFITLRVVSRVIGYDENLDQDFLIEVAKIRLEFKETWEKIRQELEKIWKTLGKKFGIKKEILQALTISELLTFWRKNNFNLAK